MLLLPLNIFALDMTFWSDSTIITFLITAILLDCFKLLQHKSLRQCWLANLRYWRTFQEHKTLLTLNSPWTKPRTFTKKISFAKCQQLVIPEFGFRNISFFISASESELAHLSCSQGCSKFHCLDGKCEVIIIDDALFEMQRSGFSTREWKVSSSDAACRH